MCKKWQTERILSQFMRNFAGQTCIPPMEMELIRKYFPDLTDGQLQRFEALGPLYREWNAKINVISRKDIDNLYEHHILHSLAIAHVINFRPGTKVMDLGTGGGFPGIPLAILFPLCHFHLVDSTKKKLLVCAEVAQAVALDNVSTQWARAEDVKGEFDFVVARAVMPLCDIVRTVRKNISRRQQNALPNGVLCLKGGDVGHEVMPLRHCTEVTDIADYFGEEYFKTKRIIYTSMT